MSRLGANSRGLPSRDHRSLAPDVAGRPGGSPVQRCLKRSGRLDAAPHLLDVVEIPDFRAEDVDDDVAGIDEHPIAGLLPLDLQIAEARRFEILNEAIRQRPDVPIGTTRSNDDEVADRGLAGDVD